MNTAIPILFVFLGCCSNVVFLELLIRECPGSGNIITCSQFIFIAIYGFVSTADFGRKSSVIPIKNYFIMVTMFFVVQVTNNVVFAFNISMPLHMIFRAGSLIANLILGVIILKRSYTLSKYLSVLMITAGIIICTFASAGDVAHVHDKSHSDEVGMDNTATQYLWWSMGISILAFALFMSARMGIFQETVYRKFGKHPDEALYYNHLLPLPGFLLLSKNIYSHAVIFNASEPVMLPIIALSIPKLWLYLIANMLTQFVCIKSVFVLTTECTSLTVTLVVTLRKFLSLLVSVLYFQNPFTIQHWMGAVLVFGGTVIFTEMFKLETITRITDLLVSKKKKKIQ